MANTESSIRLIDAYLGQEIQVIAFGISYLGRLEKVDYEKGFIVLKDSKDQVTIDLERVETFAPIAS